MWCTSQCQMGTVQPGKAQPPSRTATASRSGGGASRCARPTSTIIDPPSRTTGITSAEHARRRSSPGDTEVPSIKTPRGGPVQQLRVWDNHHQLRRTGGDSDLAPASARTGTGGGLDSFGSVDDGDERVGEALLRGLGERGAVAGVLCSPIAAVGDRLHQLLQPATIHHRQVAGEVDRPIDLRTEAQTPPRSGPRIARLQSLRPLFRGVRELRRHPVDQPLRHRPELLRRGVGGDGEDQVLRLPLLGGVQAGRERVQRLVDRRRLTQADLPARCRITHPRPLLQLSSPPDCADRLPRGILPGPSQPVLQRRVPGPHCRPRFVRLTDQHSLQSARPTFGLDELLDPGESVSVRAVVRSATRTVSSPASTPSSSAHTELGGADAARKPAVTFMIPT